MKQTKRLRHLEFYKRRCMQKNWRHLLTWKLLTCSSKGRNLFTSERREETVAVASLSAAELSVLSCSVAKSCNKTWNRNVVLYCRDSFSVILVIAAAHRTGIKKCALILTPRKRLECFWSLKFKHLTGLLVFCF